MEALIWETADELDQKLASRLRRIGLIWRNVKRISCICRMLPQPQRQSSIWKGRWRRKILLAVSWNA